MHRADMILDFQYGSTGKGLLAGWLAKRADYDTAVCSFATNAGHTYIDESRGLQVMTQQLPTAITSPTVKNVLIGPGALIHLPTLFAEMERYEDLLKDKRILIHPHAAIVTDEHMFQEQEGGMSKIGSTTKGIGAAMCERIMRNPNTANVAKNFKMSLNGLLATQEQYDRVLRDTSEIIIEGAQGFSLSMYHGFYPYTTSRDVTPWQIAADCGLPFKWASYINIFGTLRTYPIRVNNRDGSSGPCYDDQHELGWDAVGMAPELTTVTKLPRRIFDFSAKQLEHALFHCGQYWQTHLFLNFANYCKDHRELVALVERIEAASSMTANPPKVSFLGFGPDDGDVVRRADWAADDDWSEDSEGGTAD